MKIEKTGNGSLKLSSLPLGMAWESGFMERISSILLISKTVRHTGRLTLPSSNLVCLFKQGTNSFLDLSAVLSKLLNQFITRKPLCNQILKNFN